MIDHVIWDLAWVSPHREERAADAIWLLYVVVLWRYGRLQTGPLDIADMST